MKRFTALFLTVVLLMGSLGGEVYAVTEANRADFKIAVKDDAYVLNNDGTVDLSGKNYGKETELHIKSPNLSYLTRYIYLKFDVSSLAGDNDFTAIELDLMLKSKQSAGDKPENAAVEVYCVTPKGWDENTLTFANRPEWIDLVTARDDVEKSGKTYSFAVTSYVKQALARGETEVAFVLKEASPFPLHLKFEAKEGKKSAPALSVYYGTKKDEEEYYGKMWGEREAVLSKGGIDNIIGLHKTELFRIDAIEDTYMEGGRSSNTNFGASSVLEFKATKTKYDDYYRIPLIKFDISEIGDAYFSKVELELNCQSIQGGDIPVKVDVFGCYSADWQENTTTMNTAPEREDLVSSGFVSAMGAVRIDVTDYVKKAVKKGEDCVSFYLEGDETSSRRLQFTSKESGKGTAKLVFSDPQNGTFTTALPFSPINPWDNAAELVSSWLHRWEIIKQGGDADVELVERDNSEYTFTVDAAKDTETNGKNTVYTKYPTRTMSTLKGYSANDSETELYDRYGGYMGGERYEATGFFYTKKTGDRWWTIDPLGYPFYRVACVTVSMGNSRQENALLSKYGSKEGWADGATERLKELGFNSTGGWSAIDMLSKVEEPLTQTSMMGVLSTYTSQLGTNITDGGNTALVHGIMPVFDPDFVKSADETVKNKVSKYATNSDIYGWMSDNELPASYSMLDNTLALSADDPIHMYSYATAWTFMYLKTGKKDVSMADVTDELRYEYRAMVYDRYFEVIKGALERYAPYHQYMGCRFLLGCYRNEQVMRVAGYWCDVVTYNYYYAWEADPELIANQQKWAGKPFVVTEWYAKGMDVWEKDNRMENTSGAGWTVRTQKDRGLFYQNFALQLLECKGCVGFDWFKYLDNDPTGYKTDSKVDDSNINSNKGIVDNAGEEYFELTKYMDELNSQKYSLIGYFDNK